MSREHYLANAEAALKEARLLARDYVGPCDTCRYVRVSYYDERCHHPLVEAERMTIAGEYDRNRINQCGQQRDRASSYGRVLCGPPGVLWERKLTRWECFKRDFFGVEPEE